MIKLTEITRNSEGSLKEVPILVNPSEIAVVQTSDLLKETVPILGSDSHLTDVRIVRLKNEKFLTVKETMDEIERLLK